MVNLDALTYAGNPDTWPLSLITQTTSSRRGGSGTGNWWTVCSPSIVRRPSSTSLPRRTSTAPSTARRPSSRPTWSGRSRTARGRARLLERPRRAEDRDAFRFLHVSTDEVYGSLGPEGYFTEESPTAQLPLLGHQGGLRPSRAGLAPHLRPADADHQLLEQLRALPVSREADPAHDPQRAARGSRCPSTATGSNVRDWLYVEDHCRAILAVLQGGRPGETYNVGGHNERTNLEVVRTICALLDDAGPRIAARVAHHLRRGPAGPRPPLRHRRGQDRARARLEARGDASRRAWGRPCAGTWRTAGGARPRSRAAIGESGWAAAEGRS